jgi:serine/threonine-protein kinase
MKQIGKYQILDTIGKGAMGAVYKGRDEVIDRIVAIKVIHPHLLEDGSGGDLQARFQQEAKAAARCLHPNIVTIFDYGVNEQIPFMVMEYVEGLDLKSLLRMSGAVSVTQSIEIILQVLDALSYAHGSGVVHRDIKPANIMVLDSGAVKVADFGVARIDSSELTNAGDMVGTPNYMSPEALRGAVVDARSDLYAVALVLLELITGKRPTTGFVDQEAIVEQMVSAGIEERIRKVFVDLFSVSLQPKVEKRYQSAVEFMMALKKVAPERSTIDDRKDDLAATIVATRRTMAQKTSVSESGLSTSQTSLTFEPNLLNVLERSLASYIGPLSSVLVRRQTTGSTSIDQLINNLAKHIPNERERAEFLAKVKADRTVTLNTSFGGTTAGVSGKFGPVSRGEPLQVDQARLAHLVAQLAFYLGPMAPVVVKKMLKKADTEAQLIKLLVEKIPSEGERSEFLRKIG